MAECLLRPLPSPRSPLSLSDRRHANASAHKGRHAHERRKNTTKKQKTKYKQSLSGKFYVPTLLHTHARATRRTSPSQPEDKGAVVARQQVFSGTHALGGSQRSYDLSATASLIRESYAQFYSKRRGGRGTFANRSTGRGTGRNQQAAEQIR